MEIEARPNVTRLAEETAMTMKYRSLFPNLRHFTVFLLLSCWLTSVSAEPRAFKSLKGREIIAEPVSHTGDGSVQLKRDDGNLFQVKITDFCSEDQKFLEEWAKANPPKIDYRFDIKIDDEKLSGAKSSQLGGYKDVKNELWTYRVDITNLSRQAVSGLTVDYRVFIINAADGQFRSGDGITEGFIRGSAKLDKELRFNESATFTTGEVKIDKITYNWSFSRDEKYKDALRGLMLQIKDPSGKVVQEFISSNNSMKGKTWDSVPVSSEIKAGD
jgi:uncharacterized protein affecting Mg2+/Co2+ transport